jgi:hypothetical protein
MGLGYATYLQVSADTWLLATSDQLTSERAQELVTRLVPVTDGARLVGDRNMIGHVLQTEGILSSRAGDTDRATAAFNDAIVALTELGTVGCTCHCLEAIANYASESGFQRSAARLIGASSRLRRDVGVTVAPVEEHFREQAMTRATAELPTEVLEAEIAAGQLLSLSEASQLARQMLTDI